MQHIQHAQGKRVRQTTSHNKVVWIFLSVSIESPISNMGHLLIAYKQINNFGLHI